MITMFGRTESEILEAIQFYEKHSIKRKRTVRVICEHEGAFSGSFKLETWSDKGLTLWVNGKIVYQHNEQPSQLETQQVLKEAERLTRLGDYLAIDAATISNLAGIVEKLVKIVKAKHIGAANEQPKQNTTNVVNCCSYEQPDKVNIRVEKWYPEEKFVLWFNGQIVWKSKKD